MANRDGISKVTSPITGRVSWRARVSWTDPDGRRRHRNKTERTRKDAERWRRERLAEIDRGDVFEAAPVTVDEVAARWLATVERSRSATTFRKYSKVYRNDVAPRFGHRKIASIRGSEIAAWYTELGQRYAGNTIEMINKVMRGIVNHAIADDAIRLNPLTGRKIRKDRPEPPVVWTPEQARTFLAAAEHDDAAIPLVLMLATGIRIGECLALMWESVDLDARTIRIQDTIQDTPNGKALGGMPKTSTSNRTVALPAVAALALRRQRALVTDSPLVFPGRGGRLMRTGRMRELLDAYCETLQLPRLTPHGLRRTCATLLMHQRTHPSMAAKQLGHSVKTMLDKYAQVNVDMQRGAAASLDDVLAMPEDGRESRHR